MPCHLQVNDVSHYLLGKPPSLLFPSGTDIRRLGLDGNGTGSYGIVSHSQGSLGALDVWWEEKLIYWTDLRQGTIKRAKMTGRKMLLQSHKKALLHDILQLTNLKSPSTRKRQQVSI